VSAKAGGPVHKGVGKLPDRALLLFSVLIYAFLYAPILVLIFFSFNSSRSTQNWTGFSTEWYVALLQDQSIHSAFFNSMKVGVTATLIATVIGTLTALALTRHDFRGKLAADTTIYAATVMPEIVVGVSLLVFFVATLIPLGVELGIVTIVIAHVAFTISFVTIVVRARLAGMDEALEEAAQDLGANPVTTFVRVTLPLILPGVMAGGLLAFTLSFDDFVITFFVSGVGSSTLPLKIYSMIKFGVSPVINALSTVVLVATMILILGGSRILARRQENAP
jgi:spermidine/putrescine transport system permease protein